MTKRHRSLRGTTGQSLVEFAMVLPMAVVIVLGVIEVGFALIDQHIVTRMAREGSNLISRDTTLQDARTVLTSMSSRPVNFSTDSKLIFSVIKRGQTQGTANYDTIFLYQRHEYGSLSAASLITTAGAGSFGGAPDYVAANSDNNTNLRVTNLPANLVSVKGGMIYVTEIFTRHNRITTLDRFGVSVPQTLYSIAYF